MIRSYLDTIGDEPRVMKVTTNLSNVIGFTGRFWVRPYSKTVWSRGSLLRFDIGFHDGVSRRAEGTRTLDLAYAHYHYRPYGELLAYSRMKLERRVDVTDVQA